jgi:hypothetical protein
LYLRFSWSLALFFPLQLLLILHIMIELTLRIRCLPIPRHVLKLNHWSSQRRLRPLQRRPDLSLWSELGLNQRSEAKSIISALRSWSLWLPNPPSSLHHGKLLERLRKSCTTTTRPDITREAYLLRLVNNPLVLPHQEAILHPDATRSHQVTPNPHQVAAIAPLVRSPIFLRRRGN